MTLAMAEVPRFGYRQRHPQRRRRSDDQQRRSGALAEPADVPVAFVRGPKAPPDGMRSPMEAAIAAPMATGIGSVYATSVSCPAPAARRGMTTAYPA
jgi:hypothetical protein